MLDFIVMQMNKDRLSRVDHQPLRRVGGGGVADFGEIFLYASFGQKIKFMHTTTAEKKIHVRSVRRKKAYYTNKQVSY